MARGRHSASKAERAQRAGRADEATDATDATGAAEADEPTAKGEAAEATAAGEATGTAEAGEATDAGETTGTAEAGEATDADDMAGAAPRAPRRRPRPRRSRRPRRAARLLAMLNLGLVVAAAAAGLTILLLGEDGGPATAQRTGLAGAVGPEQDTLLLVRSGGGGPAAGMTLLAAGGEDSPAVVLLLPVGTLTDIPGVGLDRLGLAHQYGGAALAQATVENLLGIEIDRVAVVDDRGLGALLGRAGGFSVTVPNRLVVRAEDGTAEVRFEPGEQFLDGRRLAEYWAFRARGEDELASFSRQQQVLAGWLDQLRDAETFETATAGGLPQLDSTADAEWVRRLLRDLVAAREGDALGVVLLPVEAFGGEGPDGTSTFRPRTAAITTLVEEFFFGSVPAEGVGGAIRVQVLNGVGVPGIGEQVDRRLGGGGFRIVLTDNARDFDFTETRILVYDESSRSMAAAERVRERLGVGTIQVSRQPQSVVDLTIVVGADFLDGEDVESPPPPAAPDEE
jgi:polyisoprenyl-teichoic acid--peptidoglycan teichoic acid transferase